MRRTSVPCSSASLSLCTFCVLHQTHLSHLSPLPQHAEHLECKGRGSEPWRWMPLTLPSSRGWQISVRQDVQARTYTVALGISSPYSFSLMPRDWWRRFVSPSTTCHHSPGTSPLSTKVLYKVPCPFWLDLVSAIKVIVQSHPSLCYVFDCLNRWPFQRLHCAAKMYNKHFQQQQPCSGVVIVVHQLFSSEIALC